MKRFLIAALLIDFTLFTGYVLFADGVEGLLALFATSNLWGYQLFADLVIALGIVMAWMIGDAKQRGVAWQPYVVLTLCTGSIGPLIYIVRHVVGGAAKVARAGHAGQQRGHASATASA